MTRAGTPTVADAGSADEAAAVDLPDTGLPDTQKPDGKKRGRRPLPENLPRERVEYDLADDQKVCPCCSNQMHRMGELVTELLGLAHGERRHACGLHGSCQAALC